jgi:hypothetical protein
MIRFHQDSIDRFKVTARRVHVGFVKCGLMASQTYHETANSAEFRDHYTMKWWALDLEGKTAFSGWHSNALYDSKEEAAQALMNTYPNVGYRRDKRVHFQWRGQIICGRVGGKVPPEGASMMERISAITCPDCASKLDETVEPKT